jgi:GH15 family glucan-1,4-alpha-glucosidase
MAARIEDYAMIGDCQTAALVSREGSIDWLCLPRFDSPACFAALLGEPKHGRWLIAPTGGVRRVRRRYLNGSLVLETEFETEDGVVAVIDAMLVRLAEHRPRLVRIVEGRAGRVPMHTEVVFRFDYGSIVPWVVKEDSSVKAIAGPELVRIVTPIVLRGRDLTTVADFVVECGHRVPFVLTWQYSFEAPLPKIDGLDALAKTTAWWQEWSKQCVLENEDRDAVLRSAVILKGLTDARTGGMVAAVTTSLPEAIGGVRNWDYRYSWVRDATFTLLALLNAGFKQEAVAWREWLLRAVAGESSCIQVMYGVAGERRLDEHVLPWLPGYEGSHPVRIGNAASTQLQLDVYGELVDAMYQAWRAGLPPGRDGWSLQRSLLNWLDCNWERPDEGIWEVRGERRSFTHSNVMAWVAMDRAIKAVENFGAEGPVDRWRATRQKIFDDVCKKAWNEKVGAFTQSYGSEDLDAALLMMPLVGFLPANDSRVRRTIEAIEKGLMHEGFVMRYTNHGEVDGLPGTEGIFLPCTFWFADCLLLLGRRDDARATFDRCLAVRNDVGLLSEEYDPRTKRMLGNFPQAFSHVALVNTALNLASEATGPAAHRQKT